MKKFIVFGALGLCLFTTSCIKKAVENLDKMDRVCSCTYVNTTGSDTKKESTKIANKSSADGTVECDSYVDKYKSSGYTGSCYLSL